MDTVRLLSILERIPHYFPGCRMVDMDATVANIRDKADEELRQLKEAGVNRPYLGIECGLDDVLAFIQKGTMLRKPNGSQSHAGCGAGV